MASMHEECPGPGGGGPACGSNEDVRRIAAALDYLHGLELLERRFGPEHPKVAACLEGIASLCRDQGRLGEAETLYRRALAILERSAPPHDPRIADILENLTIVLYEVGREDEARGLFDRAKCIREAEARAEETPADEA